MTRDDLLVAHRVPPQLLGIVPSSAGGFGAADTATRVFARNEIEPLQTQFLGLNDWVGEEIVRFDQYELLAVDQRVVGSNPIADHEIQGFADFWLGVV